MSTRINLALHNRLWLHCEDMSEYLSTVCVKRIDWLTSGESVVTLEGLLQADRWLLDIWSKNPRFEIRTGICGDPTEYESGKALLCLENLKSFQWWTEDVTSRDQNDYTRLYCKFVCDRVEICG